MRRAILSAALLSAICALPAQAADPRMVDRLYDPGKIVRVEGKVNVQATIRFGEGEMIENVAIGDAQKWQVTPNKRANLLFVKPLAERAATNMTVVTDRHTYLFDLVASPAHREPLYVLSFSYPTEIEEQAETALPRVHAANEVELQAASDPYAVIDPAALNFAWSSKGDAALLPSRIFDDGEATFLAWPPGAALPAILVTDFEGTEGPVNFAVRGDMIVVDGVPRAITLRSGEDSARLTNDGPVRQPAAPPPRTLASAISGPNTSTVAVTGTGADPSEVR